MNELILYLGLASMEAAQFPEIKPSGNLRCKTREWVLEPAEPELHQSLPLGLRRWATLRVKAWKPTTRGGT